jgi:hypothetical protein
MKPATATTLTVLALLVTSCGNSHADQSADYKAGYTTAINAVYHGEVQRGAHPQFVCTAYAALDPGNPHVGNDQVQPRSDDWMRGCLDGLRDRGYGR